MNNKGKNFNSANWKMSICIYKSELAFTLICVCQYIADNHARKHREQAKLK